MLSFAQDFIFTTLNALFNLNDRQELKSDMKDVVSMETAQQIAADFMRKKKNTERIDVASVEQNQRDWIVRGTCPIDMGGHPWAEKFEVVVDAKGKVKSTNYWIL